MISNLGILQKENALKYKESIWKVCYGGLGFHLHMVITHGA
jgi:hypothetical protein